MLVPQRSKISIIVRFVLNLATGVTSCVEKFNGIIFLLAIISLSY